MQSQSLEEDEDEILTGKRSGIRHSKKNSMTETENGNSKRRRMNNAGTSCSVSWILRVQYRMRGASSGADVGL